MFKVEINDIHCDQFHRWYDPQTGTDQLIDKHIFNSEKIDWWCIDHNIIPVLENEHDLIKAYRIFEDEEDAVYFAMVWG